MLLFPAPSGPSNATIGPRRRPPSGRRCATAAASRAGDQRRRPATGAAAASAVAGAPSLASILSHRPASNAR